jgi:hypothetical protein
MNPQIVTVANAFYVGAVVVGVPSFLSTMVAAYFQIRILMLPTQPVQTSFGVKNPDAIILMLQGMVRVMGAAANFLGGLGQAILGVMAAVSIAALLFAIALFFTGRGLHAHAGWARGMGGVLVSVILLGSLLSAAVTRGPFLLLSLLSAAGSVYALRALWRGFAV